MQTLFIVFLVLNFLAEALAATTLIGGSQGPWAMTYGFGVIAIASAIAWIWPYRTNHAAVTPLLGLLMTFHVSLLIGLFLRGDQQAGVVIHGVLAVLAIVLFTQRSKWCVR